MAHTGRFFYISVRRAFVSLFVFLSCPRRTRLRLSLFVFPALMVSLYAPSVSHAEQVVVQPHAIALHSRPKYGENFSHFDYVNPEAPKGGDVTIAAVGGFDNFNFYSDKGRLAAGQGLLYVSLMTSSQDEASSQYTALAESVELAEDLSSVRFTLRPEARWHDGVPITPADVVFSYDFARGPEGPALFQSYYQDVESVRQTGPAEVTFQFANASNAELPFIIGQLPIVPRHHWQDRDLSRSGLEPPLGAGPYRLVDYEVNRYLVYERVPDWWGAELPVHKGLFNFDRIRFDYYKDTQVITEAVKGGALDFWHENSARNWATAYTIEAVEQGHLQQIAFPNKRVAPMQAWVFNLRRPQFEDPRVREALSFAFDFEWSNRTLFHGQYTRLQSFFDNSELAARGLPSPAELALLEPLRADIPPRVFTDVYQTPGEAGDSAGSGDAGAGPTIRENLRSADRLLREAGYVIRDQKRVHAESGASLDFEILLVSPSFERVTLPFARNLAKLGIEVSVRVIDIPQYIERLNQFDFDMAVGSFAQSQSPGNEQRDFWSSAAARYPGSRNLSGLQNKAVDTLIESLIQTESREDLVAHVRALDRVLLWSFIVIPQWHAPVDRYVIWNRFGFPETVPDRGVFFLSWWVDPEKDAALKR